MKENFPEFLPYWDSNSENHDLGLIIQMMPFGQYAIDVIKAKNELNIKKIFDFVEFLLLNGDESVQTAITTGFLEHLLHRDPEQIKFSTFIQHLGKNAFQYCRAYDKFTGVRTEGLWEKEKRHK